MTYYPVVEVFHSIQGEGFNVGKTAIFVRLAGCDVGCSWCDTKHSWSSQGKELGVDLLVEQVKKTNPEIVVITGGEPLMHDLTELTNALGFKVKCLETSGTHPLTGDFEWITLSPKKHRPPLKENYQRVSELKVVIDQDEDFDFAEDQASKLQGQPKLYLQPQWNNLESTKKTFQYVLNNPKWKMSFQVHKMIGVE